MKVKITGRHLVISQALRSHIQEKMERLDRYGVKVGTIQVLLVVEKYRHIAEAQGTVNGVVLQAKASTREMYQSIDQLIEKLERQLKKQKEKIKSKRSLRSPITKGTTPDQVKTEREKISTVRPVLRPMKVQEAVRMLGEKAIDLVVFTNVQHGRLQILRQIEKGQVQLIDPVLEGKGEY